MRAVELYRQGDLDGAIRAGNEEVRNAPDDVSQRIILFELVCFSGDLDRADRLLDAIAHQDTTTDAVVQVYRNVLHAERLRRRVFAGEARPEPLRDMPAYAEQHFQALADLAAGRTTAAAAALARSAAQQPALTGKINGVAFTHIADGDDVIGPFLELIILRDYTWLPFALIREMEVPAPETRRDLLWTPVRLVLQDGEAYRGYVPVLYPGAHTHADDAIRLGRATDWSDSAAGPVRGMGHRMIVTGEEAYTFLDMRTLSIDPPAAP